MKQKSHFRHDLNQEKILGRFLDLGYQVLFPKDKLIRVNDLTSQNSGIDLTYQNEQTQRILNIDEKAQLNYINKNLPTFAFELSYMKDGLLKKGWLLDENKKTDFYFLITAITLNNQKSKLEHETDIKSCLVTKVSKHELIDFLQQINISETANSEFFKTQNFNCLNQETCQELSNNFRSYANKNKINKLAINQFINIHISTHLAEQPVNLVIKLDYLLKKLDKSSQVFFQRDGNIVTTKKN